MKTNPTKEQKRQGTLLILLVIKLCNKRDPRKMVSLLLYDLEVIGLNHGNNISTDARVKLQMLTFPHSTYWEELHS